MRIAVTGCVHGNLDLVYSAVSALEDPVDLLLVSGDVETIRSPSDLPSVAGPKWHRHLGDFYAYYSGAKVAPVMTILIGGNHEASDYLWELHHGGWVAPNMYYLGGAGVVRFRGLRIAGWSGIYGERDYSCGNFEGHPVTGTDRISCFHTREFDKWRWLMVREPVDIFLSHDWPTGIAHHGDKETLLAKRPTFEPDISSGRLGSAPARSVLDTLRPAYWFASHMHVRFGAVVHHGAEDSGTQDGEHAEEGNADEGRDVEGVPEWTTARAMAGRGTAKTKFLALDKCLPGRSFLQAVTVPDSSTAGQPGPTPPTFPTQSIASGDAPAASADLHYDLEWLAIVRATESYRSFAKDVEPLPNSTTDEFQARLREAKEWVRSTLISSTGTDVLGIPLSFRHTAPPFTPPPDVPGKKATAKKSASDFGADVAPSQAYLNSQTAAFCEMVGIANGLNPGGVQG
ncbi:hypothetical protein M427DRAFT_123497 [Gonapodya prolifera JEL478]|uniref:Lariat debranching enzyme C-terminal domain-containing protein n=1 Tax=Gonapodya prolifera (strain JEL478) TaxID=1344416 RepID=A0A139AFR3_GONPJ|nr:hypothetical protein M427DRAFT_123497 [Gonapodya prolifera JEL478]|eukprot:KXS15539.1 hypothetical protein M427DRAFT_123497 [Gonapodya prolifera JEL478]